MSLSRPFVLLSLLLILCISSVIGSGKLAQLLQSQAAKTQPPTPQWQIDAGRQAKFDVASVKQNKSGLPPSGDMPNSNVALGPGDYYSPTGGLFSAAAATKTAPSRRTKSSNGTIGNLQPALQGPRRASW